MSLRRRLLWWRRLLRRPVPKSRRRGRTGLVSLVRSTPLCVEGAGDCECQKSFCCCIWKPRATPKSTPRPTFSCRQSRRPKHHRIAPSTCTTHTHTQWPHEEQSSLAPAGRALLPYVCSCFNKKQRLTCPRCLRAGWPLNLFLHPPPMLPLPPLPSRTAMPPSRLPQPPLS